jgi:hypothetical protein
MMNTMTTTIFSFYEYWFGSAAKVFGFWDILRERGDQYYGQLENDHPSVLAFDYKAVLDGKYINPLTNFRLLKIFNRRKGERRCGGDTRLHGVNYEFRKGDRRKITTLDASQSLEVGNVSEKRVVVVIDPRAGHLSGVGGMKKDLSQIGLALEYGYEVYFISFTADPEPGQKLAHVHDAITTFLKEVRKLHPNSTLEVIGNCQAGWATAMNAADNPGLIDSIGLNGSPISTWAGKSQQLRSAGALMGGATAVSLTSDLGNGHFDGAWLVGNFESLNLSNTLWNKPYKLYSNLSTQRNRYLQFERWWGGLSLMTADEIHQIVNSIFIGNDLERGTFELEKGRVIDLWNLRDMVIKIFASKGDNITPPAQALRWILKVFGSEQEIIDRNLKIVICRHPFIGHLGIFVSSDTNDRNHREFIGGAELFDNLKPGIYELAIASGKEARNGVYRSSNPGEIRYQMELTDIGFDRIREICGDFNDDSLEKVARFSERMDEYYRIFWRPWVKLWINESTAEEIRRMHYLRFQHNFLSSRNPFMWLVPFWAAWMRKFAPEISENNPFLAQERIVAKGIEVSLKVITDTRDEMTGFFFNNFFGNEKMN